MTAAAPRGRLSRVTPANARDRMKSLLSQPARREQFQRLKVQRRAKVGDASCGALAGHREAERSRERAPGIEGKSRRVSLVPIRC